MLLVVLAAVVLSACAQLALKLGAMEVTGNSASERGAASFPLAIFYSPSVWLGLAIYVGSISYG